MTLLAAFEEIIDASSVAPRIEAMLPAGVRPRQLSVRTLLAGVCLALADHRPAHLTRVHQALISLPEDDRRRLGVVADCKGGPHLLTYRQTEYTFGLVADAAGKDQPDGLPSDQLQGICDDLLEASVPGQFKDASTSLAVDWTDLESFSRPPPARGGAAPTPRRPGATARTTCCAAKTSCSTTHVSPSPAFRHVSLSWRKASVSVSDVSYRLPHPGRSRSKSVSRYVPQAAAFWLLALRPRAQPCRANDRGAARPDRTGSGAAVKADVFFRPPQPRLIPHRDLQQRS